MICGQELCTWRRWFAWRPVRLSNGEWGYTNSLTQIEYADDPDDPTMLVRFSPSGDVDV